MLNRHAIVLFLGLACLVLLRAPDGTAFAALGAGFLLLASGLLLDPGESGLRQALAHLLQAGGVAALGFDAALHLRGGTTGLHLALAELGICVAVLGVLLELRLGYRSLRRAIGVQAAGDALFLAGALVAATGRSQSPSLLGWVFIAIAGGLSLYAAAANLVLQASRLKDLQAGWRFAVSGVDAEGLCVRTPGGPVRIAWQHLEAVQQLDGRHLLLVLPAPLPAELRAAGLPVEALRQSAAPVDPTSAADRFGLILHEQELGRPLAEAAAALRQHLPA